MSRLSRRGLALMLVGALLWLYLAIYHQPPTPEQFKEAPDTHPPGSVLSLGSTGTGFWTVGIVGFLLDWRNHDKKGKLNWNRSMREAHESALPK
jgi:hypothetical protein